MNKITIGMAHYSDFDGVYFTIQDIVKELGFNGRQDLLDRLEFLIVENNKDSPHGKSVKHFRNSSLLKDRFKVIDFEEKIGTSSTRNRIIENANTEFVLVMDCHVLLCPVVSTISKLFDFIDKYPNTKNLYQGPLIYDNMTGLSTHFDDQWGAHMWGKWGSAWTCLCNHTKFSIQNNKDKCKVVDLVTQKEITECNYCYSQFPTNLPYSSHEKYFYKFGMNQIGKDPEEEPFEIFAQGCGLFFTAKSHWLGFNDNCEGFGGEECYIQEKYRRNGRKTICLPFLKWLHRFQRPDGVKYNLTIDNKVRNYILEFKEIGLDLKPVKEHFVDESKYDINQYNKFLQEAESIYGR